MIYLNQDITTVSGPAIILHGVNCQGVMDAGVAKTISDKWPKVKERYLKFPAKPGAVNIIKVEPDIVVINCYTQEQYGYDGKVYASTEAIGECILRALTLSVFASKKGINPKIYMPKIGCGLGGLDWSKDVLPLFETAEKLWGRKWDIEFNICELGEGWK